MLAQRRLVRGLRALAAVVLAASAVGRPLTLHALMRHGSMPDAMPGVHHAHDMAGMPANVAPHPLSPGIQAAHPCCPASEGCWTCCGTVPTAVPVTAVRDAGPATSDVAAPPSRHLVLPGLTSRFRQPLSTGPPTPQSV